MDRYNRERDKFFEAVSTLEDIMAEQTKQLTTGLVVCFALTVVVAISLYLFVDVGSSALASIIGAFVMYRMWRMFTAAIEENLEKQRAYEERIRSL